MIGQQNTNGFIGDYCERIKYSTHEVFTADYSSIQIFLYFDELKLCNPLGSKRTKHKIGNIKIPIITAIALFL